MAAVICIQCKFYDGTCLNPAVAQQDLVQGYTLGADCVAMRSIKGRCGPSGKLFEAKPPGGLSWRR